MTENFSNLRIDLDMQLHTAYRSPNKLNLKISSRRHIILKLSKVKDKQRIIKAPRERKLITNKGLHMDYQKIFQRKTLQARREWADIVKQLKKKKCQQRIVYLAKLALRNEGERKTFPDRS